jgi:hypothetical protein
MLYLLDAEGTSARPFSAPNICTTPSHEFIFYAALVLLFLSLSFFISLVTVCIAYLDLKNKFVQLSQTLPKTVSPSSSPSPANITSISFVQNLCLLLPQILRLLSLQHRFWDSDEFILLQHPRYYHHHQQQHQFSQQSFVRSMWTSLQQQVTNRPLQPSNLSVKNLSLCNHRLHRHQLQVLEICCPSCLLHLLTSQLLRHRRLLRHQLQVLEICCHSPSQLCISATASKFLGDTIAP